MKKKTFVFTVNTPEQAEVIILGSKIYNFKPILHLKYYLIKGFGIDFIFTFRNMLISKFGESSFKLFVDCGFDNSLCISMATKKIEYLKLKGNLIILSKIKNITNKNRVLLNPSFNIVDCRNRKKINLKLKKIYSKGKK
ncbi:hypothetical protein PQZ42_04545 [Alphaproteobacteria bacterium]|nr:hypothetical protein [Alphaproteobacteria bacterium]